MKKKFFILLFLVLAKTISFAQSAQELYEKGNNALAEENFSSAFDFYVRAANLGSIDACGELAMLYYNGFVKRNRYNNPDSKSVRDIEMAKLWASKAGVHQNIQSDNVLGLISYYEGDFQKAKKYFSFWKNNYIFSEGALAYAICLILDDEYTEAKLVAKQVYDRYYKDTNKPKFYFAACAILGYIEWNLHHYEVYDDDVMQYVLEFKNFGDDDFEYCPLNEFLVGLLYYQMADKDYKEIGKTRIEVANNYKYEGREYHVLYPFAKEIKECYEYISNK